MATYLISSPLFFGERVGVFLLVAGEMPTMVFATAGGIGGSLLARFMRRRE